MGLYIFLFLYQGFSVGCAFIYFFFFLNFAYLKIISGDKETSDLKETHNKTKYSYEDDGSDLESGSYQSDESSCESSTNLSSCSHIGSSNTHKHVQPFSIIRV